MKESYLKFKYADIRLAADKLFSDQSKQGHDRVMILPVQTMPSPLADDDQTQVELHWMNPATLSLEWAGMRRWLVLSVPVQQPDSDLKNRLNGEETAALLKAVREYCDCGRYGQQYDSDVWGRAREKVCDYFGVSIFG